MCERVNLSLFNINSCYALSRLHHSSHLMALVKIHIHNDWIFNANYCSLQGTVKSTSDDSCITYVNSRRTSTVCCHLGASIQKSRHSWTSSQLSWVNHDLVDPILSGDLIDSCLQRLLLCIWSSATTSVLLLDQWISFAQLLLWGHPFMTSTRKLGFWPPSPVHMSLPPCGRPHAVRENDLFSRKFLGFWVSGRNIFYISSAKISDDLFSLFVNCVFFNSLCGRPRAPDPFRVDVINGWPL